MQAKQSPSGALQEATPLTMVVAERLGAGQALRLLTAWLSGFPGEETDLFRPSKLPEPFDKEQGPG